VLKAPAQVCVASPPPLLHTGICNAKSKQGSMAASPPPSGASLSQPTLAVSLPRWGLLYLWHVCSLNLLLLLPTLTRRSLYPHRGSRSAYQQELEKSPEYTNTSRETEYTNSSARDRIHELFRARPNSRTIASSRLSAVLAVEGLLELSQLPRMAATRAADPTEGGGGAGGGAGRGAGGGDRVSQMQMHPHPHPLLHARTSKPHTPKP